LAAKTLNDSIATKMPSSYWNWVLQSGTPSRVWGALGQNAYYVYDPSTWTVYGAQVAATAQTANVALMANDSQSLGGYAASLYPLISPYFSPGSTRYVNNGTIYLRRNLGLAFVDSPTDPYVAAIWVDGTGNIRLSPNDPTPLSTGLSIRAQGLNGSQGSSEDIYYPMVASAFQVVSRGDLKKNIANVSKKEFAQSLYDLQVKTFEYKQADDAKPLDKKSMKKLAYFVKSNANLRDGISDEEVIDIAYNKQVGLIAEEAALVDPTIVVFDRDGAPEGINTTALLMKLLSTVQEQNDRIKTLEARLAS
jgi:hypothetical protein